MSIEIKSITKHFGTFTALNDVSLDIPTGRLVGLLGPSGSGKTTLLRIIAGLETPDSGNVIVGGNSSGRSVGDQQVGFVFQHYALFKHMTVFENIAFGLRVRKKAARPPEQEIKDRVFKLLKLVQLEATANRYPSQLSGGQRQRIALARALAVEPTVLLLDEPFGALDAKVRQELRRWLRRLHDELHVTSVFVTHDQEEALEVADRVVVLNEGKIEQIGTPDQIYDSPATAFVYRFIGNVNIFHGRTNRGISKIGSIEVLRRLNAKDEPVVGYARPHDIEISRSYDNFSAVPAVINNIHAVGPTVRIELNQDEGHDFFEAELSREKFRELGLSIGEKVFVSAKVIKVFSDDYQI